MKRLLTILAVALAVILPNPAQAQDSTITPAQKATQDSAIVRSAKANTCPKGRMSTMLDRLERLEANRDSTMTGYEEHLARTVCGRTYIGQPVWSLLFVYATSGVPVQAKARNLLELENSTSYNLYVVNKKTSRVLGIYAVTNDVVDAIREP